MGRRSGHLRLLAMLVNGGHHLAAWRHPLGGGGGGLDVGQYTCMARIAERGLLDAIFVADVVAVWGKDLDALSRTTRGEHFEPLTLLAALSSVTERIGLIATATTSYNEPYHLARKFASLDHLSSGRAGWNVVTSVVGDESRNFGRDRHYLHAERYARAEEFVDIVKGLWDSWDDDAIVRDATAGRWFDPDRLHVLDHRGANFAVRGPLNVTRPPQGHPVLVQAGESETGRTLAARIAELVFASQSEIEPARAFHAELKQRAAAFGRPAASIKIMPGLTPFIGRTRQEAQDLFDQMQALIDPVVGLRLVADTLGDDVDLSGCDPDGPLPETLPASNKGSRSEKLLALARRERLSIRQLSLRLATHHAVVGTASDVADRMQAWYEAEAADGFNLQFPHYPSGLEDFVDLVIPELQRRGLFRRAYEGRTLRENLGLERPESRYRQERT